MQKYIQSEYNEKAHRCREMRGEGVGRGRESSDMSVSLELLLRERKRLLVASQSRWNASLTEEQQESLLALREHWTSERIAKEHVAPVTADRKTRNWLDFQRFRLERGDFADDLPTVTKEE